MTVIFTTIDGFVEEKCVTTFNVKGCVFLMRGFALSEVTHFFGATNPQKIKTKGRFINEKNQNNLIARSRGGNSASCRTGAEASAVIVRMIDAK